MRVTVRVILGVTIRVTIHASLAGQQDLFGRAARPLWQGSKTYAQRCGVDLDPNPNPNLGSELWIMWKNRIANIV